MRALLPCQHCDDGLHWTSRYGGNDPDVWADGPCHHCDGTMTRLCEECSNDAVTVYTDPQTGIQYPLCDAHNAAWLEDAVA